MRCVNVKKRHIQHCKYKYTYHLFGLSSFIQEIFLEYIQILKELTNSIIKFALSIKILK